MRKLLFFSILLVCSFGSYSQTIIMKTTGPAIEGEANLAFPGYTGQVELKSFSMGVSRFLNMEDLGSTQRGYANAELSLVSISFENQAFITNKLSDALYEGTFFDEVKIVKVIPTSNPNVFREVFIYTFKGVVFSSFTNTSSENGRPINTATFKAQEIKVEHKFEDSDDDREMGWDFVENHKVY